MKRRILAICVCIVMLFGTGFSCGLEVEAEDVQTEETELPINREQEFVTDGEKTGDLKNQAEKEEVDSTEETGTVQESTNEITAREDKNTLGTVEQQESGEDVGIQEQSEQPVDGIEAQEYTSLSANGLNNPRIEKDSSMEAGQKVTWDCVWFGSYPQAEVVPSASDYTALDKSLLKSGDIIEDRSLYGKLQDEAEWNANNETTVDGNTYLRMKMSDATYTNTDTASNYIYYNWSDSDTYHYFKYEPIKWRVLKVNENQAFLLSDIVLDDQQYNTAWESITWEISTIRSWLNGYDALSNKQGKDYSSKNFIGSAFSRDERSALVNTSVVNDDNIRNGTEGGNNTTDKVFFLSESETYGDSAVTYGFVSSGDTEDEARRSKSSTYAKAMGTLNGVVYKSNYLWWLRSPGWDTYSAVGVRDDGCVKDGGSYVYDHCFGVRPALNLNLSSNLHTYAGTVSSDEKGNETGGGNTGGDTGDKPGEQPSGSGNPASEKVT